MLDMETSAFEVDPLVNLVIEMTEKVIIKDWVRYLVWAHVFLGRKATH